MVAVRTITVAVGLITKKSGHLLWFCDNANCGNLLPEFSHAVVFTFTPS